MCYSEEFWRMWWSNRTPSVSFNVVDTEKYDIIKGEAILREDYKKKMLEAEKENIESYMQVYEKSLIQKSKRLEEIEEELKDL